MSSIRDLCNTAEDDKELEPVPDIEMESVSRPILPPVWPLPSSTSSPTPIATSKYGEYPDPGSYFPPTHPHYAPNSSRRPPEQHHHQHYYNHHHRHSAHHAQYNYHSRHGDNNEPTRHDHHRSLPPPPPPPYGYDPYYDGKSTFSASNYHLPGEHRHRPEYYKDQHPQAYQHHYQYRPHYHQDQYRHMQEGYPQSSHSSPSHSSSHSSRERRMSSQAQRETLKHTEEQRVSHNHSSASSDQVVIKPDITPKREEKQNHQPLRQHPQQEEPPISKARIKIVQQPLHARMCGFGEKDRRPIDPPPIVQLILDDDPTYNLPRTPPKPIKPIKPRKKRGRKKGGKPGRKPGKKVQEAAAAAAAAAAAEAEAAEAAKKQKEEETKKKEERDEGMESDDEQENDDEPGSHDEDSDDELHEGDDEDHKMGDNSIDESNPKDKSPRPAKRTTAERPKPQESTAETHEPIKEPTPTPPPPPPAPKRRGRPPRDKSLAGTKHSRDNQNDSDSEVEWPRYEGGAEALRVDPLYVLHVSLWSEDGTEVRSMIATPGQTDPPKLTRILMGAVVVSPILLNDEHGNPGWYFSFPDLSIRTEGTYTLKFSLMQFASFDFDGRGGSHASTLIAEEISKPFSVYSAKKFPGMTESTELSKAFAKQGLKIPIRNDLRVRKSTEKE